MCKNALLYPLINQAWLISLLNKEYLPRDIEQFLYYTKYQKYKLSFIQNPLIALLYFKFNKYDLTSAYQIY